MKIFNKYIFKVFLGLSILAMVSSCGKDFLDINEDPNNPLEVPLAQLLPSIIVDFTGAIGVSQGGLANKTGTYMHHFTQRGDADNFYAPQGNEFSLTTPWNVAYSRALQDIDGLITQAQVEDEAGLIANHYLGIGQILKAYVYSLMVDFWADVPFSEANLLNENLNPRFDPGETIYPELFTLINLGRGNLASTSSTLSPAGDDLIYGGDLDNWRKFANTLELKLLNQTRLVSAVGPQVSALISANDLINTQAQSFQLFHGTNVAPDDRHPGFTEEWAGGLLFYYASPYLFETMAGGDTFGHRNYGSDWGGLPDPRIPYYIFNQLPAGSTDGDAENPCAYCPSRASSLIPGNSFLSIWMFSFNIDPNEGFDQNSSQSALGLYAVGGAVDNGIGGTAASLVSSSGVNPGAPLRMLNYFHRLFIEAELIEVGELPGVSAPVLASAIAAAFAEVNTAASSVGDGGISNAARDSYIADVMTYFNGPRTSAERLEVIMAQKWIASFGFAVDTYTDYRRTGFPILHDGNTDNLAVTIRSRQFPHSLPWPTAQLQINSNSPPQKNVVSAEAKPFWMP